MWLGVLIWYITINRYTFIIDRIAIIIASLCTFILTLIYLKKYTRYLIYTKMKRDLYQISYILNYNKII